MWQGPSPKIGVVLVLTVHGEAGGASFFQAGELLVPEVPAPRTLIDVAADGADVPDLWRADFSRRIGDCRIHPAGIGVLGELRERHRRANPHPAVRRARNRAVQTLHVDQALGLGDVVLHHRQEIHPAGERKELAALRSKRRDRFFSRWRR